MRSAEFLTLLFQTGASPHLSLGQQPLALCSWRSRELPRVGTHHGDGSGRPSSKHSKHSVPRGALARLRSGQAPQSPGGRLTSRSGCSGMSAPCDTGKVLLAHGAHTAEGAGAGRLGGREGAAPPGPGLRPADEKLLSHPQRDRDVQGLQRETERSLALRPLAADTRQAGGWTRGRS